MFVQQPAGREWVEIDGRATRSSTDALVASAAALAGGSKRRTFFGSVSKSASPDTAAAASLGDHPDATRDCMRRSTAISRAPYNR